MTEREREREGGSEGSVRLRGEGGSGGSGERGGKNRRQSDSTEDQLAPLRTQEERVTAATGLFSSHTLPLLRHLPVSPVTPSLLTSFLSIGVESFIAPAPPSLAPSLLHFAFLQAAVSLTSCTPECSPLVPPACLYERCL